MEKIIICAASIIFFISYKIENIFVAAYTSIIMICVLVGYSKLYLKYVSYADITIYLITIILNIITIYFRDPLFIKLKVTIINWLLGLMCIYCGCFNKMLPAKKMLEKHITLSNKKWKIINLMWIIFFFMVGSANWIITYRYTTEVWVIFKCILIPILTTMFLIMQVIYVNLCKRN